MAPRAHLCPGISQYRPPFARNRATTLLASSRLLAPPRPAAMYSRFYKLSLSLPSAPRHGIRIAGLCIAQIWNPVLLCPPFCLCSATMRCCQSARDRIAQRYARARVRFWRAFLPCLRFAIRRPRAPGRSCDALALAGYASAACNDTHSGIASRSARDSPLLLYLPQRLCAGALPALHSCAIAIRLRYAPARASRVAGNRPAACDSSHAQLGSPARLTPPSQTLSRATSSSALDTRIPDILGWEGHPVPRHF
ncbi:hypothetical protein C8J57DRAFT_1509178 [Mycena rebaudengoi]|nr:hypothetical protein C8J57DRAFT_1509178 [Mycena rebaudengoi]